MAYCCIVLYYDTALNEAERPVITWGQVPSIGIVFVVLGKRILDGKPGGFPARHELRSQSPRAQKGYSCSSSTSKQTTLSTNEYRLTRQTCPGLQSVAPVDLDNFKTCISLGLKNRQGHGCA